MGVVIAVAALAIGCGPTSLSTDGDDDDNGNGDPRGADASPGPGSIDAASPGPGSIDAATSTPQPDARVIPPPGGLSPGSECTCDADCESVAGHAGICVYGICMTRASADCSAGGSTAECATGSRCWGLSGAEGSICWPDCASYSCDGGCDSDGSCAPESGSDCGYTCGSYCSCEPGDCGTGLSCVGGTCVPETSGDGPGMGPGPSCPGLPVRDCSGTEAFCGELVYFTPRTTPHYDDYPINGETPTNQYRSYLRRDLKMLLDYATAKTECKSEAWATGIGGALGFGDMSEADGAIPGTSIGSPGHPASTHTNGFDIDLAYYQAGTVNNYLRPVCEHTIGTADQYHCTAAPDILDVWRTAFFLGVMFESPRTRVIGVDGKVGPLVTAAIDELCSTGWLTDYACDHIALAFEETDMGYGWFYFHHHHAHISLEPVGGVAPWGDGGAMPCKNAGCGANLLKPHPRY